MRSVTSPILLLTFLIAVVVSSTNALKAVVFIPFTEPTAVFTWTLINCKSVELFKSSVLSDALAFESDNFPAFVLTTSTTEFSADLKAALSLAPAPSAAAEKAVITLMTC